MGQLRNFAKSSPLDESERHAANDQAIQNKRRISINRDSGWVNQYRGILGGIQAPRTSGAHKRVSAVTPALSPQSRAVPALTASQTTYVILLFPPSVFFRASSDRFGQSASSSSGAPATTKVHYNDLSSLCKSRNESICLRIPVTNSQGRNVAASEGDKGECWDWDGARGSVVTTKMPACLPNAAAGCRHPGFAIWEHTLALPFACTVPAPHLAPL